MLEYEKDLMMTKYFYYLTLKSIPKCDFKNRSLKHMKTENVLQEEVEFSSCYSIIDDLQKFVN